MIRKIFPALFITLFLVSCGNSGKKVADSRPDSSSDAVKVEFAALINDPSAYIGKNISVEGKVVHVCTMSGKKLFLTGENPDIRLYVQAGEEMPKFPMELLGSNIVVEGKITPVSGTSMEADPAMQHGEGMAKSSGADTCETEKAMAKQTALADLMMIYNKHTLLK